MALPTQAELGGLDFVEFVLPFAVLEAGSIDTKTLDYVEFVLPWAILNPSSASLNAFVNVSGTWKQADSVHVNVSGTWKEVDEIQSNISSTWKT